jgi:hypothetical protein
MYYLADFKKGYRGDFELENPLNGEEPSSLGSKILKGSKWAAGATASGKVLDLGRRAISYRVAKNNLNNPKIKLTTKQKSNYQKIFENKGAKGEIGRNIETIKGLGNIGDIGQKTKNLLKTRKGKFLAGGLGTLGLLGGIGYKKAKEYYYL